jgi:hypothetical protein
MDNRAKRIDVNYNMDEYMSEMWAWAERQGLHVMYNWAKNEVLIRDTTSGEAGMFDMFEFLCSDSPRKFFAENF